MPNSFASVVAFLILALFLCNRSLAKKLTPAEQAAYLRQAFLKRVPTTDDYYVDDVIVLFTNITTPLLKLPPLRETVYEPPTLPFYIYDFDAKPVHVKWEADFSYQRKSLRAYGHMIGESVQGDLFVDARKDDSGKFSTCQYSFEMQPLNLTVSNFTLGAAEYENLEYAAWDMLLIVYANEALEGAADDFFAKLNEDPPGPRERTDVREYGRRGSPVKRHRLTPYESEARRNRA